jgi:hypothetical protein
MHALGSSVSFRQWLLLKALRSDWRTHGLWRRKAWRFAIAELASCRGKPSNTLAAVH